VGLVQFWWLPILLDFAFFLVVLLMISYKWQQAADVVRERDRKTVMIGDDYLTIHEIWMIMVGSIVGKEISIANIADLKLENLRSNRRLQREKAFTLGKKEVWLKF
jgi:hypothetical protein